MPDDAGRFAARVASRDSPGLAAIPAPSLAHLRRLTADLGLWEHALGSSPRTEHGFCTDDNARALLVVLREAPGSTELIDLASTYLGFVLDSRIDFGRFHNRRRADGVWIDAVGSDDSQGRAWWALGRAARFGPTPALRRAAADAFASSHIFESPHLRSNAYTALGAVEMIAAQPGHSVATALLERTAGVIADAASRRIPWPEDRLTYDNGRLPEALLAAGATLGRSHLIAAGLRLLEWLVRVETNGEHLSFTPHSGWAPGEPRPAFDQQPIEAAALADACFRAWSVTRDPMWKFPALGAAHWLLGRNDLGIALYDAGTGATSDGLMEYGANQNRGAESTLAGISTLQVAARLAQGGMGAPAR
ncbi:MAG: glycosyltransferase [Acidimicrobiia bacterium]